MKFSARKFPGKMRFQRCCSQTQKSRFCLRLSENWISECKQSFTFARLPTQNWSESSTSGAATWDIPTFWKPPRETSCEIGSRNANSLSLSRGYPPKTGARAQLQEPPRETSQRHKTPHSRHSSKVATTTTTKDAPKKQSRPKMQKWATFKTDFNRKP